MRINVNRICPHSNRVTAAVCLQKGGASNDDISFRLRWHPTPVPTYLRSCFDAIGEKMYKVLLVAYGLHVPLSSSSTT